MTQPILFRVFQVSTDRKSSRENLRSEMAPIITTTVALCPHDTYTQHVLGPQHLQLTFRGEPEFSVDSVFELRPHTPESAVP